MDVPDTSNDTHFSVEPAKFSVIDFLESGPPALIEGITNIVSIGSILGICLGGGMAGRFLIAVVRHRGHGDGRETDTESA